MPQASPGLRERALRLLAQREHSRQELARKLAAHGTPEEIAATLERLGELGLQADARFAEAWVRAKSARHGTARLRHELAQRGVERELIEAAIASEAGEDEIERARGVWRSRFGTAPADRAEWARQARFLHGRGFASATITKLLKELPDESAQG